MRTYIVVALVFLCSWISWTQASAAAGKPGEPAKPQLPPLGDVGLGKPHEIGAANFDAVLTEPNTWLFMLHAPHEKKSKAFFELFDVLAKALKPHNVRVAKVNIMKDPVAERLGVPLDAASRQKLSFPLFKVVTRREGRSQAVMHSFPSGATASYESLLAFATGGWKQVQGMSVAPARAQKREDPMAKMKNFKMPDLSHLKDQLGDLEKLQDLKKEIH